MTKTNNDEFRLVEKEDILVLEAFIVFYKYIHNIKIFAYSILSNHLHFLHQNSLDENEALYNFYRDVKREFAKYYNIAYGRKGSFWKAGLTSKEIASENQIVNTAVYILNNPVKARKCDVVWEYAFSSFHLPMTKAAFKTMKQTKDFLTVDEAFKLIKKTKKSTSYGIRLPKEDHLARGLAFCAENNYEKILARKGRKEFKLRGPFSYRHEYNPYCRTVDIKQTFTTSITDPFPKEMSVDSKSLSQLCQIRTNQSVEDPFKTDGMNIVFESVSKKACFKYQEKFFDILPTGALHPYSIIESNENTWKIVIVNGRTRKY